MFSPKYQLTDKILADLTAIAEAKKIDKKLSWKDFNKIENEKLLDVDGLDKLIDKDIITSVPSN